MRSTAAGISRLTHFSAEIDRIVAEAGN